MTNEQTPATFQVGDIVNHRNGKTYKVIADYRDGRVWVKWVDEPKPSSRTQTVKAHDLSQA